MIPKSLHTVTALANVARHLAGNRAGMDIRQCKGWCIEAAIVLGYAHHSDGYCLLDKAAATLLATVTGQLLRRAA